jgi:maleylpyruvate isomerase
MGSGFVLHNYFRSSTSYRVRIALNLKGLDYRYEAYHLRKGEQRGPAYLKLNPQGLVPTLELPGGVLLTQSLAIVAWIDETHPEPPLLPADALGRARVRALAETIALDIHPVNNLRVLADLRSRFGATDADVAAWFNHWVHATFGPLEAMLAGSRATGRFCHGDRPTLADVCLVPQVANGGRFGVDMASYPTIRRIHEACMALDAFSRAAPAVQPDAEP